MPENTEHNRSLEDTEGVDRAQRGRRIVVLVLGVAVAAAVVFGVIQLAGRDDHPTPTTEPTPTMTTPEKTSSPQPDDGAEPEGTSDGGESLPTPGQLIPEAMGGQEAIDALGDNIDVVAERHKMTPDELKNALLTDASLQVTPSGLLLYMK